MRPRLLAAVLPLALLALAAAGAEPPADYRIRLTVAGDLFDRQGIEPEAVLDFNDLLPAGRVLAQGGLALRETTAAAAVPLELAQDTAIRYASGNPILRLRWSGGPLPPFGTRAWDLDVRTVQRGDADAWKPLEKTFSPGAKGGVVFSTSFEDPNPDNAASPAAFLPGGRDQPGEKSERVWSDAHARTGKRSLRIARTFDAAPPANTNRPFWWTWPPSIPARPGTVYRLSGWIKSVAAKPGTGSGLNLIFRDENKSRITEPQLKLGTDSVVHDWRLLSGSVRAPERARWVELSFYLHGEGEACCDDVEISVVAAGAELPALPVAVGRLESRSGASAAGRKTLRCGVAAQPPRIDGALDDPCWKDAGRSDDFEVFARIPGTEVKTAVLACADRDALYFGFECHEPSTEDLVAKADRRDGPVWSDDSVEIFLDTNLDRRTYYQVIVNPKGVIFDQDTGEPGLANEKWNGPITAAARVEKDRWTAEVRIEFAGLRLAEADATRWGANFCRTSLRKGRSLYAWVRVGQNFGEPENFGEIVLPFDATANAVTGKPLAPEQVFWGPGILPFEVRNRRAVAVPVRLDVAIEGDKAAAPLAQVKAKARPSATTLVKAGCAFAAAGEVRLRYDLIEEPSGRLLYSTSRLHIVPPPLEIGLDTLVSYAGEAGLTGRWALGFSEAAAAKASLTLAVLPKGQERPVCAQTVTPQTGAGGFRLDVATLPNGWYDLRAELRQDQKVVGEAACRFERTRGPFNAP